jgi:hypothetical protein
MTARAAAYTAPMQHQLCKLLQDNTDKEQWCWLIEPRR